MSKRMGLLVLLVLSVGCASKPFHHSRMKSKGSATLAEYKPRYSIEEIEQLKPQLNFPIKLAITQPAGDSGWSPEEIKTIKSWEKPLKYMGFLSELIILPETFSRDCGWRGSYFCRIEADREAAARFKADALLMMSMHTETQAYSNLSSILNLTVIGMWIVPAHHRDSLTLVEGTLIDNRNEYLYAFAKAYGEEKTIRPYAFAKCDISKKESRRKALQAFGTNMIQQIEESYSNKKDN